MDRRSLPRCTDCNRAVMYFFRGRYAKHCYAHATAAERQTRTTVYLQMVTEAVDTRRAELNANEYPEHLGPEHYRIEPGD